MKAAINGENNTNFSTEAYRQLQQIKIKIRSYSCILSKCPVLFSHENHHHILHNHIFIVFPCPHPPQPHYYCFPTTATFLLFSLFLHQHHCHHQSSSVFPPSPPHFYCFPYPTTTITTFPMHILLLMFSAFTYSILAGKAFGFVSKNCVKQNTTHSSYPT